MIGLLLRSPSWGSVNKIRNSLLVLVSLSWLISACSNGESGYFPLSEGGWWEYRETLVIRDETTVQRRIISTLPAVNLSGTEYFAQQVQGSKVQYYRLEEEGITRYALEKDTAESEILLPMDLEDTWSRASRLGVIESRTFAAQDRILTRPKVITLTYKVISDSEAVAVPAGRFKNCLKIQGTGQTIVKVDRGNASAEVYIENTDWYAPGIGLIKTERIEKSTSSFLKEGRYTLELLEYNQG